MKTTRTYLNGKAVFIVSLLVIGVTLLLVCLTGIRYHRDLFQNLYLSLSIIAMALFLFMTCGLYVGLGLKDNFPKLKNFKKGMFISNDPDPVFDIKSVDTGDGIAGIIVSIFVWIAVTILMFILFIVLEAVLWISIFVILAMLYWMFFRAMKTVFSKSDQTKGNIKKSVVYAFTHTAFYVGWIFAVGYLIQLYN